MKTKLVAGKVPATIVAILVLSIPLVAQTRANDRALTTAEGVVAELYDIVTFDAGTSPDWDRARSLFLPEAVVVLRTSREGTSQFTLDGWVEDFETFIEDRNVVERGFVESIVKMKPWVFKSVAHIMVLYEAGFPDEERRQYGIDSIHLVEKEGRWWIADILNEIPDRDNPIPPELRP